MNDESDTPQETMTLAPAPEKAPEGPSLGIETVIEENQSPALACPVLGFGASSGGLKASKGVPENLDPNTGMAFVLTTHLAPDRKSFFVGDRRALYEYARNFDAGAGAASWGVMAVASKLGEGTTVWVDMPVQAHA